MVTSEQIEAERQRLQAMLEGAHPYVAKNISTALGYLLSAREVQKLLEEA